MSGAVGAGIKQFDLYDFFSVFLPGAALIVGVLPLFPSSVNLNPVLLLGSLLVGGFVLGRGVHAGAIRIENYAGTKTHRDQLTQELESADVLTSDMVNEFYDRCRRIFGDIALLKTKDGGGIAP